MSWRGIIIGVAGGLILESARALLHVSLLSNV